MIGLSRHIKCLLLLVGVTIASASCMGVIDLNDDICDYNVQLRYDYNLENTSSINQVVRYVKTLEEYIFDNEGRLYAINPLALDICTGQWVSELTLPPGRYSVIAVGNRTAMSRTHDRFSDLKIGVTRREDMMLTLTERSTNGSDDGRNFSSCGRIFHGYRTFSVEAGHTSLIRVDMVHSHLDLRFTIRWKGNKTPVDTNDFYVILKDLPSEYNLMPEYIYPTTTACKEFDCDIHDEYNRMCHNVRHHITQVRKNDNVTSYREDVVMRGNEIMGQTISYRIRNMGDDRVRTTISLYSAGTTLNTKPVQLMKEIHLNNFLNRNYIDLDQTLKQQYHIVFEINPDTGEVHVRFAEIADWDEGGGIAG